MPPMQAGVAEVVAAMAMAVVVGTRTMMATHRHQGRGDRAGRSEPEDKGAQEGRAGEREPTGNRHAGVIGISGQTLKGAEHSVDSRRPHTHGPRSRTADVVIPQPVAESPGENRTFPYLM
jgi:hypothetical protein